MNGTVIKTLDFPGGRAFAAVFGNLLEETTDAIVNAANGWLAHGGGVAAAISQAAGPELAREGDRIVREHGCVPVGEAVVTTAGRLPFKGVIHTVGPRLGEGDEEGKLVRSLKSAFLRAHERGWNSLSFPAISSGIFAVPAPVCARAYVRAAAEFLRETPETPLRLVRLVLFQGPLADLVKAEMERHENRR
jgi:putative ATPase